MKPTTIAILTFGAYIVLVAHLYFFTFQECDKYYEIEETCGYSEKAAIRCGELALMCMKIQRQERSFFTHMAVYFVLLLAACNEKRK